MATGNVWLDNYMASGPTMPTQNYNPTIVPTKVAPQGNFIQRNLNVIGGGGGAVAGGLTGAAIGSVVPVAGTAVGGVIGAILGGAAGGAAGEAGKEDALTGQLNGNEIAKQAAIQGAFGAAGEAGNGVKLIRAAQGVKLGGAAADAGVGAVDAASNTVAQTGTGNASLFQRARDFLAGQGNDLTGGARGITPGAKVAGQDKLGVQGAQELNQFLDSVGVKGKNATDQLAKLEQLHTGWGQQIGDIVKANNVELAPTSLTAVKDGIASKITEIPGLPKAGGETALVGPDGKAIITTGSQIADHPYIDSLYQDLSQVKDLKGLNDFRQKLDSEAINYGRSSAAPDPVKEQIAKAFRGGISDYVGAAIPDLKPLQNLYGQSADAQDFLKAAAGAPKGGVNLLGPFGGPKVGGDLVQSIAAKVGSAAQKVAGTAPAQVATDAVTENAPGFVKGAVDLLKTGATKAALVPRAVEAAIAGHGNAPTPPTDTTAPVSGDTAPTTGNDSLTASDGIDIQGMLRQALSNPDAKTQAAQLAMIKDIQAIQAASQPKTAKPLSSTASQQLGNAQSGLAAISTLRTELAKNANLPTANAGASLFGNIGRGAAGTQSYDAARSEVTDILARLRTGAAISKTEEAQYKALLPTAFDTPQVVQQKLDRYQSLFQGIADRAQAGSPALEVAGAAVN